MFAYPFRKEIDIKEIKIDYCSGFRTPIEKSTLKISKNWISYKSFKNDKIVCNWDYKTSSEEFVGTYNRLCEDIKTMSFVELIIHDGQSINITVRYVDDSVISFQTDVNAFQHSASNEWASHALSLMLSLIPKCEEKPEYLRHQTIEDLDFDIVEDVFRYLSTNSKVEYSGTVSQEPSTISILYPDYDSSIVSFLNMFEPVYDYDGDKAFLLIDSNVEELLFGDIKLIATYLLRDKHFDGNLIASCIENGKLLKWVTRLKELKSEFDKSEK